MDGSCLGLTPGLKCPKCRRPITRQMLACQCGQVILNISLQPKQQQLYDLVMATGRDVPTKIGFGGSRGSAKSRAGRDLALLVAFQVPNIVVYVICRNYGLVKDNYTEKYGLERPGLDEFYHASLPPEYAFPKNLGGSRIAFRYTDTLADAIRIGRGPEAYLIIIEQAEQFSEEELDELNKPNRWPEVAPGSCKTVYLFNPGGQGTEWLRRVFYLEQYKSNERPGDFAFIQAYGWDNFAWFKSEIPGIKYDEFYRLPGEVPPCPAGVYDNAWLATVPDEYRFKLYVTQTSEGRKYWGKSDATRMGDLFGRFDQFAGQYFAGVWDERKCVISTAVAERIAKPWWRRWMSMDWGFGHHAAVYWFATGTLKPSEALELLGVATEWPLDVVIVYRELVAHRMAEHDLARAVVDMTPEPERKGIRKWVAGSDVWIEDRKATHTIAELIEDIAVPYGLPRLEAAQDRSGSRVINARMLYEGFRRTSSMLSANPPAEAGTTPMLLVSAECPELIAAIPMLICDPKKPEDVLKMETMQDDVFDGAKYGFAEYMDVRVSAPRDVRAREVLESVHNPNAKAMAMRQFNEAENRKARVISRPRWRS